MCKVECLDISVRGCEEQEYFISQSELNIWNIWFTFSQTADLIKVRVLW